MTIFEVKITTSEVKMTTWKVKMTTSKVKLTIFGVKMTTSKVKLTTSEVKLTTEKLLVKANDYVICHLTSNDLQMTGHLSFSHLRSFRSLAITGLMEPKGFLCAILDYLVNIQNNLLQEAMAIPSGTCRSLKFLGEPVVTKPMGITFNLCVLIMEIPKIL